MYEPTLPDLIEHLVDTNDLSEAARLLHRWDTVRLTAEQAAELNELLEGRGLACWPESWDPNLGEAQSFVVMTPQDAVAGLDMERSAA